MAITVKKQKLGGYIVRFGKSGSVTAKTKREATKVAKALRKLEKVENLLGFK